MTPNETAYLAKFRETAATHRRVEELIAQLREICDSLKDWRVTAAKLAESFGPGAAGWSEERLRTLPALRENLLAYHRLLSEARGFWNGLTPEQRTGLTAPFDAPG